MTIDKILQFSAFLDKFRKIERTVRVNGSDRNENDMEHSYMLALLAWYICSSAKLDLDLEKIIRYALVHDLVEIYSGDTDFYHATKEQKESKHAREQAAMERITKEFPEFTEFHELYSAYENRADKEAKFVYALDKVQPVLMIYLDGGRTWNERNITLDMIKEKKDDKVGISPEVAKYWKEFIALLEENKETLFKK